MVTKHSSCIAVQLQKMHRSRSSMNPVVGDSGFRLSSFCYARLGFWRRRFVETGCETRGEVAAPALIQQPLEYILEIIAELPPDRADVRLDLPLSTTADGAKPEEKAHVLVFKGPAYLVTGSGGISFRFSVREARARRPCLGAGAFAWQCRSWSRRTGGFRRQLES